MTVQRGPFPLSYSKAVVPEADRLFLNYAEFPPKVTRKALLSVTFVTL